MTDCAPAGYGRTMGASDRSLITQGSDLMSRTPEEVVASWMSHINKRNMEGLVALYDARAIMIPTFSNRLLNTPEKIRKYFANLIDREELSIALHENTLSVQPVQGDLYTACGIYCWRFAVEGELLSFEARFSFFLNLASDAPILQHHSSQIPRTL